MINTRFARLKRVRRITCSSLSMTRDSTPRSNEFATKFSHEPRRPDILPIRQGRETVRVTIASIEWIDAAGDYMCIHAGGSTHILRGTMKELEEILDPKLFQRVHRSTIVNLSLVKSLRAHMNGEYFLTLEGGHELKLSRTYRDKVEYFLKGART